MSRISSSFALVALLLCVALGLALVLPAPSSDTRELLSWGLHPTLSTPKQPPLMQWMGFVVLRLAWPTTFWCVALMQALNTVGLVYVYRTLRLWQEREPAGLLTVLLAGAVYFLGAPVAFALNADILQFPFWAAMLFHALRGVQTQGFRHWAALAFAFALAFYTKYTVALLVVAMVFACLAVPAYRRVFRDPRLYGCAALALALLAPHLIAAPHSGALGHATGAQLAYAGLSFRLKNLSELILGFVAYLAPAWIWLAVAGFRGELRRTAAPPPAAFVRASAAAALAILLALVLGLGFKYPSRYDSPFLFLAWIAAASFVTFEPQRFAAARRWMTRATTVFAGALLIGGALVYGVFTIHPRQQEPLIEAAARLAAEWRQRFSCGPGYVMGDFWSAYGLGVSMTPPLPGVHLTEMAQVPGYDPAVREREGAIVVYRDRIDIGEIRAVFPDLDVSSPKRLTLPFARTLSRKAEMSYEYVFVAPKGCP